MSLFPRTFITDASPSSFHPLFRFFDEFDQYAQQVDRQSDRSGRHGNTSLLKTFTPRFDVKEVKDGYELHGEFPGVDQKDIHIEFTDSNTLTIKGRTERHYSSGTPPTGFIEGEAAPAAITEKGHGHNVTVEDEGAENKSTAVTEPKPKRKEHAEEKFWVSERSVGEFSRSFSFPVGVDQDGVKATMKNGILSVLVPKAKKHESKKITIE